MNKKNRLTLKDTGMDMIIKMSEGNPGCVNALIELVKKYETIDPDYALGGLGAVLRLDDLGIYGSSIYVLYSDQCDRDIRTFILLMRANQLGFLPDFRIKEIAADQTRSNLLSKQRLEELDKAICDRLPSFKRKPKISS